HEALSENTAVLNKIKLLAVQRMEGMGDPYLTAFLVRDGCNRRGIEKHGRSWDRIPACRVPGRKDR
ncbi:MAG TPA: hypothetical protein VGR47_07660, partial [Terracidiphilus sp.]|nr:hypothetical protein [Terracidiphilus sp.]